ncbi:fam-m protein [Plasmodium malariae]|uniref:Fam-m protein n=1 Tax=Plasmodium malariae TaxID=5858 RepID=A0A1D3TE03_PLAMA|nr:fam-m protein [Plasmodium malariae]SCP03073.1 fam-m protein [Plasmodium malariae]
MEQNIKTLFLIKISMLILFTRLWHFINDMNGFIKSSDESYTLGRVLKKRTYRLLAEYKENKGSNIVVLKDMPNYKECKNKDKSNNKKGGILKNGKPNKSLSKKRFYIKLTDYNDGMSDRKYFNFEKKWIRKKDYEIFQEQNKRISDKNFKKIKFRSYGFAVAVFFLFFLFGIGFPILQGLGYLRTLKIHFLGMIGLITGLDPTAVQDYICSIFFGVLIIILAIVIITTIPKILINNEEYKKFKLMNVQKEQ